MKRFMTVLCAVFVLVPLANASAGADNFFKEVGKVLGDIFRASPCGYQYYPCDYYGRGRRVYVRSYRSSYYPYQEDCDDYSYYRDYDRYVPRPRSYSYQGYYPGDELYYNDRVPFCDICLERPCVCRVRRYPVRDYDLRYDQERERRESRRNDFSYDLERQARRRDIRPRLTEQEQFRPVPRRDAKESSYGTRAERVKRYNDSFPHSEHQGKDATQHP